MRIDQITDLEAVAFVLAVLAAAWAVVRFAPGARAPIRRARYSDEEIAAHDGALPKYFLASAVALVVGGLHASLKTLPPAFTWLQQAGYGGHLVRDIANSHLVIVVGGTVAATGLTWYALPRIARRPLHSHGLAAWSFWCTVLGAGGFYLTNVVLGLVLGGMVRDGWQYQAAKEAVGLWYAVPVGLSATLMGVGYWTFVLEVLLTVRAARWVVEAKPHGHLLKFFVVGALGLFVGTVQGVIQVMPEPAAWIRATAPAGEYIDPIAHAHVNLVTGTLSLVAGLAFYWAARSERPRRWFRLEQAVFWTMVPGSVLFYAIFMALGLIEGSLMLDRGMSFSEAVDYLGPLHAVPLAVAGTLTLAGVWLLLGALVWRFGRAPGRPESAPLLAAALALFVGTTQGLTQLLPAVKAWLVAAGEAGDAVANAHAQLNMLGGVMLALVGLALAGAPDLVGRAAPAGLARLVAILAGCGIALYYVAALAGALVMGGILADGGSADDALAAIQPFGPAAMALGAALYTIGFGLFARFVYAATARYRREAWHNLRTSLARYEGTPEPWRARVPRRYFLAAEAVGAAAGFPGIGWLMAGRPLLGLPLALVGPALAWAVIPVLGSPYGSGPLVGYGPWALITYLAASACASTVGLAGALASRGPLPAPPARLRSPTA